MNIQFGCLQRDCNDVNRLLNRTESVGAFSCRVGLRRYVFQWLESRDKHGEMKTYSTRELQRRCDVDSRSYRLALKWLWEWRNLHCLKKKCSVFNFKFKEEIWKLLCKAQCLLLQWVHWWHHPCRIITPARLHTYSTTFVYMLAIQHVANWSYCHWALRRWSRFNVSCVTDSIPG